MASIEEAIRQLDAGQMRRLIAHIVENVDDAGDVGAKCLEAKQSSMSDLHNKSTITGGGGGGGGEDEFNTSMTSGGSVVVATSVNRQMNRRRSLSMVDLKGNRAVTSVAAESTKDVKAKINGHMFQSHTYFTPAFCEHCNKLLKGLIRQGQQCSRCFLNSHKRCVPYLPECEGRKLSKKSRRRRKKEVAEAPVTPLSPNATGDESSSDSESDEQENDFVMVGSPRLVRGGGRPNDSAEMDWTTHSASFRSRLQHTRPLDIAALRESIAHPEALMRDYRNIPENKVPVSAIPRFTEYKNRFMNILPNAHSRVVLSQVGDDTTSVYINANWMRGYNGRPNTYIASQGPLRDTVNDFWRMIWDNNAHVIVMITNLEEGGVSKCERYWPGVIGDANSITFGDIIVTSLEQHATSVHYSISKLTCRRGSEVRQIEHIWWRDWPDKGVPQSSDGVINFVKASHEAASRLSGPIVVHCSAGVGRTGCFLAVDLGLMQFQQQQRVDIIAAVCQLRQDRGCTVQTFDQFKFIHQVLLDHLEPTANAASTHARPISVMINGVAGNVESTTEVSCTPSPGTLSPRSAHSPVNTNTAHSSGDYGLDDQPRGGDVHLDPQAMARLPASVRSRMNSGSLMRPPSVRSDTSGGHDGSGSGGGAAGGVNGETHAEIPDTTTTTTTSTNNNNNSVTLSPPTINISDVPITSTSNNNSNDNSATNTNNNNNSETKTLLSRTTTPPTLISPQPTAATTTTAAVVGSPPTLTTTSSKIKIVPPLSKPTTNTNTVTTTPKTPDNHSNNNTPLSPTTTPTANTVRAMARFGIPAAGIAQPPPMPITPPGATAAVGAGDDDDDDVGQVLAHDFRSKTFVVDTQCSVCNELLVGVCKQGLRCRPCGQSVHAHCLEHVVGGCVRATPSKVGRALPVWPPRRASQKNGFGSPSN